MLSCQQTKLIHDSWRRIESLFAGRYEGRETEDDVVFENTPAQGGIR